jgi:hypothetical protein
MTGETVGRFAAKEIPQEERETSPEELIRDLTARIDRGLNELGVPPRDERQWGWCNFVPDAVAFCAIQDAHEKGYKVQVAKYQARDLHFVAAGKPTPTDIVPKGSWSTETAERDHNRMVAYFEDPDVMQISDTTFGHGFNIATINGSAFIMDLSFAQFMGPDGELRQGGDDKTTGMPNDHPLAQQLLHDGFVPLTDENLRTYMRLLSTYQPDYLDDVTTDLLRRTAAIPFAVDDNELSGNIPDAYRES